MSKLPPLPQGEKIVTPDGSASLAFTVYWQQLINQIGTQITDLTALVASIAAAQAAAAAAQVTANAARVDAENVSRDAARINSYTSPSSVLTATDAGASATINIAAHVRVYPMQGVVDVSDVSIVAGTITGRTYSTLYYVYYDDPTLALTNPTFQATTSLATASVGAAAGRHFIGKVTTPAAAAINTTGIGNPPTGGGSGDYIP